MVLLKIIICDKNSASRLLYKCGEFILEFIKCYTSISVRELYNYPYNRSLISFKRYIDISDKTPFQFVIGVFSETNKQSFKECN